MRADNGPFTPAPITPTANAFGIGAARPTTSPIPEPKPPAAQPPNNGHTGFAATGAAWATPGATNSAAPGAASTIPAPPIAAASQARPRLRDASEPLPRRRWLAISNPPRTSQHWSGVPTPRADAIGSRHPQNQVFPYGRRAVRREENKAGRGVSLQIYSAHVTAGLGPRVDDELAAD